MTAPYAPQQPQYPQPVYPAQPPGPPQYQQPYVPPPTQQPGYAPPPAYPQAPPPPPAPQAVDLNARLYGAGIPPELQGRTVGEGLRYYGIMREDFAQRQAAMRTQQPLQGQPQQQAPQYQQQPPQGQPSAQPRGIPGQAPIDPMRQYVAEAIRDVMPEFMNPVIQPIQQQNLERTYNGVKSRYQDWNQFEGEILQSLQGADLATLNNPAAWEAAYRHAVGNAVIRQRQGPQQQFQQPGPPQGGPPQYQPQQPQYPQYPQQAQTFVEGPTPPAPMGGPGYGPGQDPRDEDFARRFGVPVEVYRSWRGGRVGMLPDPRQQVPPQDVWGYARPPQQQYPQGGPPGYPPQGYAPNGQYSPPPPPGFYQPPVNGASYGR